MIQNNTYEQNMINYLRRTGYSHFERAGIYCIRVDNKIVYIGKSSNMLRRMAQHLIEIKKQSELKYTLLAEARSRYRAIRFDILYSASDAGEAILEEELGKMEGEYIRAYRPPLNTQIPKAENWRQYETKTIDAEAFRQVYIDKGE